MGALRPRDICEQRGKKEEKREQTRRVRVGWCHGKRGAVFKEGESGGDGKE